jgi:hypothetical protein
MVAASLPIIEVINSADIAVAVEHCSPAGRKRRETPARREDGTALVAGRPLP